MLPFKRCPYVMWGHFFCKPKLMPIMYVADDFVRDGNIEYVLLFVHDDNTVDAVSFSRPDNGEWKNLLSNMTAITNEDGMIDNDHPFAEMILNKDTQELALELLNKGAWL